MCSRLHAHNLIRPRQLILLNQLAQNLEDTKVHIHGFVQPV